MEHPFLPNPYDDYIGQAFEIDKYGIRDIIQNYIKIILSNTDLAHNPHPRGDLYIGDAGIAYMFLRLCQTNELVEETSAKENAMLYINRAKANARKYSKHRDERCAFLYGNAGIHAVSAAIYDLAKQPDQVHQDLKAFETGFEACKPINFGKYGSDEMLVGRAGFLSGVYWLNQTLKPEPFGNEQIIEICDLIVQSGKHYYIAKRSPLPLMYQYHKTEYLGMAHGLSGILWALLQSPWFTKRSDGSEVQISNEYLTDVKHSIDALLDLQEPNGNFPIALDRKKLLNTDNHSVQWCNGIPGIIYLLIKAYQVFKDERYLQACIKATDLIWKEGILLKGPGLCHGVAGNGYVFLILYRVTGDKKYLYMASAFADGLVGQDFNQITKVPDHPYSLYEGLSGAICFLVDLINQDQAEFPFLNMFN